MRVKADDLGMDFSIAKGYQRRIGSPQVHGFLSLCVFSVTASAVVRGFCLYWPGLDWGFLSPLMVLGEWEAVWVFEGFLGTEGWIGTWNTVQRN